MSLTNLVDKGKFVMPVPQGHLCTLRYNGSGILDSVWEGLDVNSLSISSPNLMSNLLKGGLIPSHLSANGGTAWVMGVVYGGEMPNECGLYEEVSAHEVDRSLEANKSVHFLALTCKMTSMNVESPQPILNYLKCAGFDIAKGFICPAIANDDILKGKISATGLEFSQIVGFMTVGENVYHSLNRTIDNIVSHNFLTSFQGIPQVDVRLTDSHSIISRYEYESLGVADGDYVIVEESTKLVPFKQLAISAIEYTCPVCGKLTVLTDEFETCSNPSCMSTLYTDINHFLTSLDLFPIEFDNYIEKVNDRTFTQFSDILLWEPLADIEIVASLYDLIDAIIPVHAVRNRQEIWDFVHACNLSWETVKYYLNNPYSIQSDLNIVADNLVSYLSDPSNGSQIIQVITYSNIVLSSYSKKFEGAPIFRGKKFYLTGKFVHGSHAEVSSILSSYDGQITKSGDDCDCVILGEIMEDVNGAEVTKAKAKGVPVMNETSFFNQYQIDEDLC